MTLTIRLSEDEEKELKRIMNHHNEKTASKAIKGIIMQFMDLREAVKDSSFKLISIESENREMKNLIAERKVTQNKLNQIQSKLTRISNK